MLGMLVANITSIIVISARIICQWAQLPVSKPTWVMFMIFGLLGSLGLLLFGREMVSSSMQRAAGGKMRSILRDLTDCLHKMNSYSANVARALVQRYGEKSGATKTADDDV